MPSPRKVLRLGEDLYAEVVDRAKSHGWTVPRFLVELCDLDDIAASCSRIEVIWTAGDKPVVKVFMVSAEGD